MKFLYFTDPHMKGSTPINRQDVYYVAILKKLWEIGNVIAQEKIDYVIIGGDVFDTPIISNRLFNMLSTVIRSWKVKVFVVPGNHDIFGQSIESLEHTSLGTLDCTGVVKVITRKDSPYLLGKKSETGNLVSLTAQEYFEGIDAPGNTSYEISPGRSGVFKLLVAHGFVVNKPYRPDVPHTVIKDIQSSADLILTGHYHPETFDEMTPLGTHVLKPIALGRLDATKFNLTHKPQILLFEVQRNQLVGYEFRDIACASDGADIFDAKSVAEHKEMSATIANFTAAVDNVDLSQEKDIYDMLREIAGQTPDVTSEHIAKAVSLMSKSEQSIVAENLNGFIPVQQPVYITKVVIQNFQSHSKTELDLSKGLNALVGASHNGKTAVIRAINWCLYNEPNGNDFIRDGEKSTSVTLTFNTGKTLERKRTRSESGTYIVTDSVSGNSTTYSKFSNAIPIEVFNTTQMPKIDLGCKKKVCLNYAKQLDSAFLLSMSASERASAIGAVTHTNVIDEAVNDASKSILNMQKETKTLEKEIQEKDLILDSYKWLEGEEKLLDSVDTLIESITLLETEYEQLEKLETAYNEVNQRILDAEKELQHYGHLQEAEQSIKELEGLSDWYLMLDGYEEQYGQLQDKITECDTLLQGYQELPVAEQALSLIAEYMASYNEIEKLYNTYDAACKTYDSIDLTAFDDLEQAGRSVSFLEQAIINYEKLATLSDSYQENTNLLQAINQELESFKDYPIASLEGIWQEYKVLEKLSDDYKSAAEEFEKQDIAVTHWQEACERYTKEYQKLLAQCGTCPICGNKIDDVSHITL